VGARPDELGQHGEDGQLDEGADDEGDGDEGAVGEGGDGDRQGQRSTTSGPARSAPRTTPSCSCARTSLRAPAGGTSRTPPPGAPRTSGGRCPTPTCSCSCCWTRLRAARCAAPRRRGWS